jgi:hypothetical protein
MKTSTAASTTQELVNHFIQQVWIHDWGYIVLVGAMLAIDAAFIEWRRGARSRRYRRR